MGKMNGEDLFREIGEIDETYVEEARQVKRRHRASSRAGRTLVTAASLILCVGVGYAALQLTWGSRSSTDSTSNAGGAMEAAQELYSMEEAEDLSADVQASEGAVPENMAPEASTTGQDNREAAAAQQEALKDAETEADGKQSLDALSEPKEEGSMPENEEVPKEETVMATADVTWEAARTDADYGRYVDVQVPEGYSYASGIRWTEGLRISWSKGMEEISISCRHADESVSDWLVDIDNPEEYDLGLYTIPWSDSVPEELIQKVTSATFRPDQVTQEIVSARSYQMQEQGDVSGWRTHIAILYSDNVLVEICSKGPSPEKIYELINLEN